MYARSSQAKSNEHYFGMNMLKLFTWYKLGSGERSAKSLNFFYR